ncbi:hypothetical protein ACIQV3_22400 [Streptomyces sp. NPDC099050]|uniref:hypothetical protein n=1 Tax=Streptomyces sp. NPDC099050 TaxID=3366100 RepID=UPI0038112698
MDADPRLAEITARVHAASKGPWTVEAHQPTLTRRVVSDDFVLDANLGYLGNANQPDAAFIAAAREDVPWLVAELTEARVKLEADGKAIDDLRAVLVERDKQIAELIAAEPTLDDDQPGAPR